jgi:hypothetical protein
MPEKEKSQARQLTKQRTGNGAQKQKLKHSEERQQRLSKCKIWPKGSSRHNYRSRQGRSKIFDQAENGSDP